MRLNLNRALSIDGQTAEGQTLVILRDLSRLAVHTEPGNLACDVDEGGIRVGSQGEGGRNHKLGIVLAIPTAHIKIDLHRRKVDCV